MPRPKSGGVCEGLESPRHVEQPLVFVVGSGVLDSLSSAFNQIKS